jgi:hypothetical protein
MLVRHVCLCALLHITIACICGFGGPDHAFPVNQAAVQECLRSCMALMMLLAQDSEDCAWLLRAAQQHHAVPVGTQYGLRQC